MSNMMTCGQSRPSIEELNVRLVFTTSTSPIARMPPPSSNAWPHAKGKLRKRHGFGAKLFFHLFCTVSPAFFMQKQTTHDDIVSLGLNQGNNEVLDVPTTPRRVALVERGRCIFKRHMPTDPNATSLSTRQWKKLEKDTYGGMTQKVR